MKFHHVGLIVQNLDKGKEFFDSLIPNLVWSDTYQDPIIGVSIVFGYSFDGLCYELLVPFGDDSPILNHLTKQGNMIHHLAYIVENFEDKLVELRGKKLVPLGEPKPAVAFKGKKVAFFLTPIRTIMEIVET